MLEASSSPDRHNYSTREGTPIAGGFAFIEPAQRQHPEATPRAGASTTPAVTTSTPRGYAARRGLCPSRPASHSTRKAPPHVGGFAFTRPRRLRYKKLRNTPEVSPSTSRPTDQALDRLYPADPASPPPFPSAPQVAGNHLGVARRLRALGLHGPKCSRYCHARRLKTSQPPTHSWTCPTRLS